MGVGWDVGVGWWWGVWGGSQRQREEGRTEFRETLGHTGLQAREVGWWGVALDVWSNLFQLLPTIMLSCTLPPPPGTPPLLQAYPGHRPPVDSCAVPQQLHCAGGAAAGAWKVAAAGRTDGSSAAAAGAAAGAVPGTR